LKNQVPETLKEIVNRQTPAAPTFSFTKVLLRCYLLFFEVNELVGKGLITGIGFSKLLIFKYIFSSVQILSTLLEIFHASVSKGKNYCIATQSIF